MMKHRPHFRMIRGLVALAVLITSNSALLTNLAVAKAQTAGITPMAECVVDNGNGVFTARFGYHNQNSAQILIPVGGKNKFTPDLQDRGQPTTLQPGRVVNAFAVTWNGSDLTWTLKGPDGEKRTATANSRSPACTPTPTPVPPTNTPVPPTATSTNTPVPPTATPTSTPVPPTVTPTSTPVPPTETPTNTPVPPTETPTSTFVPPTETPTNTPVPPTATATDTPAPPTATPTTGPIQTNIQIISAPDNLINVQCLGPYDFTFAVLAADPSQGAPTGTMQLWCSPLGICPVGFLGTLNAPGPATVSIADNFSIAVGETLTLTYVYTPADPTRFAASSQSSTYQVVDEICVQ